MERDLNRQLATFYSCGLYGDGDGVRRHILCGLRERDNYAAIPHIVCASDYFWDINNPTKEELALFEIQYPKEEYEGIFMTKIHSLADNL